MPYDRFVSRGQGEKQQLGDSLAPAQKAPWSAHGDYYSGWREEPESTQNDSFDLRYLVEKKHLGRTTATGHKASWSALDKYYSRQREEPASAKYDSYVSRGSREQQLEDSLAPAQRAAWDLQGQYYSGPYFDPLLRPRLEEVPELRLPYHEPVVVQPPPEQRPRELFLVRHKPVAPCRRCESKEAGVVY
jgi:hypothetical protein